MFDKKELVELAIHTYRNQLPNKFSQLNAEQVLREAFKKVNGGTEKITYRSFRRNKLEIFEVLEDVLQVLVSEGLTNQFSGFAEVRNMNWGDSPTFTLPDPSLFRVATVSDGNGDLRRQRLDSGQVSIPVSNRGVKIYEEFYRFLIGRISWVDMVNKVRLSIQQSVANDVYNAIYNSFNVLASDFRASTTASDLTAQQDRTNFDNLMAHVEAAAGGADIVIYGTRMALSKITPVAMSNNLADIRNQLGYYGVYNGAEMREIKQAHKPGTTQFAIDDKFVLIVPQIGGEKIVKIVNEGEPIIQETPAGEDLDMAMEYTFIMRVGVGVVCPFKYGIYKFGS